MKGKAVLTVLGYSQKSSGNRAPNAGPKEARTLDLTNWATLYRSGRRGHALGCVGVCA